MQSNYSLSNVCWMNEQSTICALRNGYRHINLCKIRFKTPNGVILEIMREYIMEGGFPDVSEGKVSACNVGNLRSIPELVKSPEEGNGFPFRYSSLGNPMDSGAWRATVHGITQSRTWLTNTLTLSFQYYGRFHYVCIEKVTCRWLLNHNQIVSRIEEEGSI